MAKPLSNTLLSLRFMQNANRAKQQAEVEAEQAKVKDEAEWSVPQSWRDAWGIGSSSASSYVTQYRDNDVFLILTASYDILFYLIQVQYCHTRGVLHTFSILIFGR